MQARHLILTAALAAAAAWTAPVASATFDDALQRHVIDEGKGLNAQSVAIRVGRSTALGVDRPEGDLTVVPRPGSPSICDVVGLPVRCDTTVTVVWFGDDPRVTVTRPGDRFTFDSRAVS